MANTLARLLGRSGPRPTPQEAPSNAGPPVDIDALPLEGAQEEPLALVPAAIYRQPLFAPNELTPAWLQPRPSPTTAEVAVAEVVPSAASKPPKRTARPKPAGSPGTSRPRVKRPAKTDH